MRRRMFGNLRVAAIAAVAANRVIGRDNDIPWRGRVPGEQKVFRDYTLDKAVIMGRNTWESLPEKYRPLPNRLNIVLTSLPGPQKDRLEFSSVEEALLFCDGLRGYDEAVLIGGQRVYEEGLRYCDKLYLSQLAAIFPGDTYFPELNRDEWFTESERHYPITDRRSISYTFKVLRRLYD